MRSHAATAPLVLFGIGNFCWDPNKFDSYGIDCKLGELERHLRSPIEVRTFSLP
jgi:hypothetical protein